MAHFEAEFIEFIEFSEFSEFGLLYFRCRIMRYELRGTSYEVRATNYELRITNYELRITSYELRATNYELRITSYELRATSYELRATNYELRITRYELRDTNYELRITNYELRITRYARQRRASVRGCRGARKGAKRPTEAVRSAKHKHQSPATRDPARRRSARAHQVAPWCDCARRCACGGLANSRLCRDWRARGHAQNLIFLIRSAAAAVGRHTVWRALRTLAVFVVAFAALLDGAEIIDEIEHDVAGQHLRRLVLNVDVADRAADTLVLAEGIEDGNIDFGLAIFEEFVAKTTVEEEEILIEAISQTRISEVAKGSRNDEMFGKNPIDARAGVVVDVIGIELGAELVFGDIVRRAVGQVKIYVFVDVAADRKTGVGVGVVGEIILKIDDRRRAREASAEANGEIALDGGDGHGVHNVAVDREKAVEIYVLRELRAFVEQNARR